MNNTQNENDYHSNMKQCVICGRYNPINATKCKYCGHQFGGYKINTPNYTPSNPNNSDSDPDKNWGCILGVVIVIIIICFGVIKGCSYHSIPTSPKGNAIYEGKRVAHNIHKEYPNIQVYNITGNRAGHVDVYTNFDTMKQTKIKSIWNNIYDDGDNNDDNNNITLNLYGKSDGQTVILGSGDPEENADTVSYGDETYDNSDDF